MFFIKYKIQLGTECGYTDRYVLNPRFFGKVRNFYEKIQLGTEFLRENGKYEENIPLFSRKSGLGTEFLRENAKNNSENTQQSENMGLFFSKQT